MQQRNQHRDIFERQYICCWDLAPERDIPRTNVSAHRLHETSNCQTLGQKACTQQITADANPSESNALTVEGKFEAWGRVREHLVGSQGQYIPGISWESLSRLPILPRH